jgi:translation initiation factor IF-2
LSPVKTKKEVEVWVGMTVEDLASAMAKDIGEPD